MKRDLLKVSGYFFDDEEDANDIEAELFCWLERKGYYFVGMIDKEEDEITLGKED